MEGVYSTRSVWAGPKEVVHLTYDPEKIGFASLLEGAKRMECTSAVYTFDDEQNKLAAAMDFETIVDWKDSLETRQVKKAEQKYYLRNSILAYLPLTELQAVKINASLYKTQTADPLKFLSPRQKQLLKRVAAILEKDKDALAEFSFPEDQANLIDYHKQLLNKLDELEK